MAAAVILAVLALGGCAVGPTYEAPTSPAPAAWKAPLPHAGSNGNLADWWRQFDDPALSQLIEMAGSDSPNLNKAWANIEKARATLKSAQGALSPSVSGSGAVSRSKQQAMGAQTVVATTRSAGTDASWEIDLFGKLRHNTEAAQARAEARYADWHDARISLAAEVADTYVQYRACGMLAEVYGREEASTAETEKATSVLVRAGLSAPADGALARASLANSTSTVIQQQAQCELFVKSLVYLTGSDEAELRSLMAQSGTKLPQPTELVVQSVPAKVLRQRPDLASLERELAASSAEIGVAQADLYPSLSLSGSITVSAASGASSLTTWAFGPSLSIPIFDGGRRRAAVDSAQASYQTALAGFRQGVRTAVKEVEQALVNLDSTARRAEEAERAASNYRRYFLATEANWRAGGESLLSLEEARRSALSAQISLLALQRDRVEHWISLYKALGGGWKPGTPASPPGESVNTQIQAPTEASKTSS
ncbi:efflux transporter outer membrane subunit [Acidovorax sp. HMWF018]|uniref:efflux transporter outer membrane subunit n=1 Tax=Acidovorax sp. HMWF018 TaxID=2056855 RepID=UPI001E3A72A9|nr:efflux transporter outer membrane subunit [Acidovorax sp. HMWF018]